MTASSATTDADRTRSPSARLSRFWAPRSARLLPTPRLAPPSPALDPFPPQALTAADLIAMARAARRTKPDRPEDLE